MFNTQSTERGRRTDLCEEPTCGGGDFMWRYGSGIREILSFSWKERVNAKKPVKSYADEGSRVAGIYLCGSRNIFMHPNPAHAYGALFFWSVWGCLACCYEWTPASLIANELQGMCREKTGLWFCNSVFSENYAKYSEHNTVHKFVSNTAATIQPNLCLWLFRKTRSVGCRLIGTVYQTLNPRDGYKGHDEGD